MKRGEICCANLSPINFKQQVRTISKQRILGDTVYKLSRELTELVNDALKLHFSLE